MQIYQTYLYLMVLSCNMQMFRFHILQFRLLVRLLHYQFCLILLSNQQKKLLHQSQKHLCLVFCLHQLFHNLLLLFQPLVVIFWLLLLSLQALLLKLRQLYLVLFYCKILFVVLKDFQCLHLQFISLLSHLRNHIHLLVLVYLLQLQHCQVCIF